MPKIEYGPHLVECGIGDNLRKTLMHHEVPLYNGVAKHIHCRGLGTCGTCAVQIEGDVTPMTAIEKWRLAFPPHQLDSGLRLACQCKVMGDLRISKVSGLWGHDVSSRTDDNKV